MKKYHTVFLREMFSYFHCKTLFKNFTVITISSKAFLRVQKCCGYKLSQTILSQPNHALLIQRLHQGLYSNLLTMLYLHWSAFYWAIILFPPYLTSKLEMIILSMVSNDDSKLMTNHMKKNMICFQGRYFWAYHNTNVIAQQNWYKA